MIDLPPTQRAIGSNWVYNVKRDELGNVQRFKARLLAKGCSQQYDFNYSKTFRYSTIRMILALAAERCLYLHHIDISTANLNSPLEEE